jgi:hypothetical protein
MLLCGHWDSQWLESKIQAHLLQRALIRCPLIRRAANTQIPVHAPLKACLVSWNLILRSPFFGEIILELDFDPLTQRARNMYRQCLEAPFPHPKPNSLSAANTPRIVSNDKSTPKRLDSCQSHSLAEGLCVPARPEQPN